MPSDPQERERRIHGYALSDLCAWLDRRAGEAEQSGKYTHQRRFQALAAHLREEADHDVPQPIGHCEQCRTPYYTTAGFCGGCTPGGPQ